MTAVIVHSILNSEVDNCTVTLSPIEANLEDIIKVAKAMTYEVDYCDCTTHYEIWGWTAGITDDNQTDWRLELPKPIEDEMDDWNGVHPIGQS